MSTTSCTRRTKCVTMENPCNINELDFQPVFEVPNEPITIINGVPDATLSDGTGVLDITSNQESDNDDGDDPCFGNWLEGRKVQKKLQNQIHLGKVEKYNESKNCYRVVYQDGNSEDLNWEKLEEILVPLDISIPLTTLAAKMCISVESIKGRKTHIGSSKGKRKTSESSRPPHSQIENKNIHSCKVQAVNPTSALEMSRKSDTVENDNTSQSHIDSSKGKGESSESMQILHNQTEDENIHSCKVQAASSTSALETNRKSNMVENDNTSQSHTDSSKGKRKRSESTQIPHIQTENKNIHSCKVQAVTSTSALEMNGKLDTVKNDNTSQSDGGHFEGRNVLKWFGNRHYFGEVKKYDKETEFYTVAYEDGSSENLKWNELENLLVPINARTMTTAEAKSDKPKKMRVSRAGGKKKINIREQMRSDGAMQSGSLIESVDDMMQSGSLIGSVDDMKTGSLIESIDTMKTGLMIESIDTAKSESFTENKGASEEKLEM